MVNRRNHWLQRMIGLGLMIMLAAGLVVGFRLVPIQVQAEATGIELAQATQPDYPTPAAEAKRIISPTETPFALFSPLPKPTATWVILPTLEILPVPTAIPTPQVTVIPTIMPPYIGSLLGKALQPFWIYDWHDNEIWRVDNQGNDRELLLDTYQRTGKWLTFHPMAHTDCCWSGARLVVSPNGQKLALILVDKGQPSRTFTFSIYVYDVKLRQLKFISDGYQVVWSPDNRHLAFSNGGLWVANLDTGDLSLQVAQTDDKTVTEFAWSPDSGQIAFIQSKQIYEAIPIIWVINVAHKQLPTQILKKEAGLFFGGITWSLDGKEVFYLSPEGSNNHYGSDNVQNLWAVNVVNGVVRQLTNDMFVAGYTILPNRPWLSLTALHLYERGPDDKSSYDLWLLNPKNLQLRRLTAQPGNLLTLGVNGDGEHLLVADNNRSLQTFSLVTGLISPMKILSAPNYALGRAK